MNINFGKVEGKSIILAPDAVKITTSHTYEYDEFENYDEDGNPIGEPVHKIDTYSTDRKVYPPTAEDYMNAYNGPFLPNEFNEPNPPEGKEVDEEIWVVQDGKNVQTYSYKDIVKQPRVFSKFKLEMNLFNMGKLDKLDEFIDNTSLSNDQGQVMSIRRPYSTANEFDEDHPLFVPYLKKAQEYIGVTDEELEQILQSSIK